VDTVIISLRTLSVKRCAVVRRRSRLRAHTSAGRTQLATWPTRPTGRANYREFLGGGGGGGGSLREMRGRLGRVGNSPRR